MPGQAWVNKMTRLNIWEAMHIRCMQWRHALQLCEVALWQVLEIHWMDMMCIIIPCVIQTRTVKLKQKVSRKHLLTTEGNVTIRHMLCVSQCKQLINHLCQVILSVNSIACKKLHLLSHCTGTMSVTLFPVHTTISFTVFEQPQACMLLLFFNAVVFNGQMEDGRLKYG